MTDERTKEEVYDDEISPLMTQIIAICKRAAIPVHAAFALDGDMQCTTHVAPARSEVPEDDLDGFNDWVARYDGSARVAQGRASHSPLMLTLRDKDGNIKSMEAIL